MPTKKQRCRSHARAPLCQEGKLLLVGGNEDKTGEMEILRVLVAEAGGAAARIEVITTAGSEPERTWKSYERAFEKIGVEHAAAMHIGSRGEAADPTLLERIAQCTAILFAGGDQLRITSILGATPVAEAIHDHLCVEGRLVAGTSAGAVAVTDTIIYDGESPKALHKGAVLMTGGLGLISSVVVDTHFMTRGRFGRLIQVVAGNPRLIGVGLAEDTGILVGDGSRLKVVGSGLAIVVDGADIGFTDVFDVEPMDVFSVESVRVHVLSAGAGFDLEARTFEPPPARATPLGSGDAAAEVT